MNSGGMLCDAQVLCIILLLPTAFCLLPTAYCLLLSACCFLPTACCLLLTAYCLLLSAYCFLLLIGAPAGIRTPNQQIMRRFEGHQQGETKRDNPVFTESTAVKVS